VTKRDYIWVPGGPPAVGQQHTFAKHDVLHAYLRAYVRTLAALPQQDVFRLTLVDGFAGGGLYVHERTRELKPGSPLIFLQAVEEEQAALNSSRVKPLEIQANFIFVEANANTVAVLKNNLVERGYGGRLDRDIKVIHGCFEDYAPEISNFISAKTPRSGRAVFLLDQCGYTDVPTELIRRILATHRGAEVILTFAVDALINFASDSPKTASMLAGLVPNALKGRRIEDIKTNERDARLYIQSCLYKELVEACGAKYYTVFFIRTEGHGDYWLVHLSQHHRARDVMTAVHWAFNNHFIHYAGAGVDMFEALGYESFRDKLYTGQGDLGFLFDDAARIATVNALTAQLPARIFEHGTEGITFAELFASTCNSSPADSAKYREALEQLAHLKEIDIVTPEGGRRQKAASISGSDRLLPRRQYRLPI
jgi:three-Cys-motif partner protein